MTWTVQNVADLARLTLNDSAKDRYTDAQMLVWTNDCLQAMSLLAPHLFASIINVTPVADQSYQDILNSNADALALYSIIRTVSPGDVVYECDYWNLVAFNKSALRATSAVPENWARYPNERDKQRATRYFLSPPPITGTQLVVEVAVSPTALTSVSDTVLLPIAYKPAVANYLIFRAESVDDVNVVQQRAAESLQSFLTLMGAGVQTKQIAPEGTA